MRVIAATVKVCFAGSTVAGVPFMIMRETFGERILPETVVVFEFSVDSSIGDSKITKLPFPVVFVIGVVPVWSVLGLVVL